MINLSGVVGSWHPNCVRPQIFQGPSAKMTIVHSLQGPNL
jgi:hypothetical protein